jgi:excisionase family DNA binding protein
MEGLGLLTIDQTAEFVGLSAWTVRYWIRAGRLPSVKIGRRVLIERTELNRLVFENRRQGTGR